jgi:hypothetical protein
LLCGLRILAAVVCCTLYRGASCCLLLSCSWSEDDDNSYSLDDEYDWLLDDPTDLVLALVQLTGVGSGTADLTNPASGTIVVKTAPAGDIPALPTLPVWTGSSRAAVVISTVPGNASAEAVRPAELLVAPFSAAARTPVPHGDGRKGLKFDARWAKTADRTLLLFVSCGLQTADAANQSIP